MADHADIDHTGLTGVGVGDATTHIADATDAHDASAISVADSAGNFTGTDVEGMSLFVANVDGTLLAYRNSCASCGGDLTGGALDAGSLACPSCGRTYFLPGAGRSMDDDHLQLQPIPLLREAEGIKVAL